MKSKYVYCGFRTHDDLTLTACWLKIADNGEVVSQSPWADGHLRFAATGKRGTLNGKAALIGEMREIDREDDGTCTPGNDRETWPNAQDRLLWQAQERAAQAVVESSKTLKNEDFGEMTLGELKAQYARTIGFNRQAGLIAAVLRYVTG